MFKLIEINPINDTHAMLIVEAFNNYILYQTNSDDVYGVWSDGDGKGDGHGDDGDGFGDGSECHYGGSEDDSDDRGFWIPITGDGGRK